MCVLREELCYHSRPRKSAHNISRRSFVSEKLRKLFTILHYKSKRTPNMGFDSRFLLQTEIIRTQTWSSYYFLSAISLGCCFTVCMDYILVWQTIRKIFILAAQMHALLQKLHINTIINTIINSLRSAF